MPDTGFTGNGKEVAQKIEHLKDYQGVADPAIWQRTGHDGPTIAEIFATEGRVTGYVLIMIVAGLMQSTSTIKKREVKDI